MSEKNIVTYNKENNVGTSNGTCFLKSDLKITVYHSPNNNLLYILDPFTRLVSLQEVNLDEDSIYDASDEFLTKLANEHIAFSRLSKEDRKRFYARISQLEAIFEEFL